VKQLWYQKGLLTGQARFVSFIYIILAQNRILSKFEIFCGPPARQKAGGRTASNFKDS